MSAPPLQLPPSLDLPPHLSAHKYFFVCTLTVAAWDTLVLFPRGWRLSKTDGQPPLKVLFNFLRVLMPIEFTVVGVAFFDTKWSQETCQKFFLFEPIVTAILLAAASAVHVIRIHAIYDKSRTVLLGMGALFAAQIVVTAICCGFYMSVPLEVGQGCIAGPKHNWVGIYWLAPTLLYTASFALAMALSFKSRQSKPLGLWKLMLRDGLNLYGAIWIVNATNVLFWFIMKPTGPDDPVKTIVTSMAAVLTTTMSLRIILSVRGSLVHGGSYAGASASQASSHSTHIISGRSAPVTSIAARVGGPTFTLDEMRSKPEGEWAEDKGSVDEQKAVNIIPIEPHLPNVDSANLGVKVTIDREVDYDSQYRK